MDFSIIREKMWCVILFNQLRDVFNHLYASHTDASFFVHKGASFQDSSPFSYLHIRTRLLWNKNTQKTQMFNELDVSSKTHKKKVFSLSNAELLKHFSIQSPGLITYMWMWNRLNLLLRRRRRLSCFHLLWRIWNDWRGEQMWVSVIS